MNHSHHQDTRRSPIAREHQHSHLTRRDFVRRSALGSGALVAGGSVSHLAGCGQSVTGHRSDDPARELVLYAAAGTKAAVAPAVKAYTQETGRAVTIQYGGSGTLLTNLSLNPTGDLFIAADATYLDQGAKEGLIAERLPLAEQRLVIAVPAQNPRGIRRLDDLLAADADQPIRIGMPDPHQAAAGRVTREVLRGVGQWDAIRDAVTVFKPTVNDVLNDLVIGALDAIIVWDATAAQSDRIDAIHIAELDANPFPVEIGVLNSAVNATDALHLARYLSARDRGADHFRAAGFTTAEPDAKPDAKPHASDGFAGGIPGDVWVDHPEVQLYLGSMLRAGAEDTLRAFEAREGCTFQTNYNGCGILVAQMKAGAKPDAYFACDVSYVEQVKDRFPTQTVISQNDLVLAVPKGNPKQITTVEALRDNEATFGVCDPAKSALGGLTHRMLTEHRGSDFQAALYDAAAVHAATGDQLVMQLLSGALDAAIVYRSNVLSTPENLNRLEVIALDLPGSRATQPFAPAADTDHYWLLTRLLTALQTQDARTKFESSGFVWAAGTTDAEMPQGDR